MGAVFGRIRPPSATSNKSGKAPVATRVRPLTTIDAPAVFRVPFRIRSPSTQNITCIDTEIRYCDGDGLVVRNSRNINIDAGDYDE